MELLNQNRSKNKIAQYYTISLSKYNIMVYITHSNNELL